MTWNQAKWAGFRLLFYFYIGFSIFSVVGGFLTSPVMTYLIFGDWKFWRHWSRGWRLIIHSWRMLGLIVKGENDGFMFSVPLTSPPTTVPDKSLVHISATWEAGSSCGTCDRCCTKIGCPVLEKESGLCAGYNSFFWRYFNCGRFPTQRPEIEYYGCPKWAMNPGLEPLHPYPIPTGEEPLITLD